MRWTIAQLSPVAKANWRLLVVLPVALAVLVAVLWYVGQGWALVLFSAALVLGTLVLAWETAALARANLSLAKSQARTEIRDALDAAKKFIEIDPAAFVDVVKGPGVGHPWLNAIDELARYGNVLHDEDTVGDAQKLAAKMDNVKIRNETPNVDEVKEALVKLQQRAVQELVYLRRNLRAPSESPGADPTIEGRSPGPRRP